LKESFGASTIVHDFYEVETANYYKLDKVAYDTILDLKKINASYESCFSTEMKRFSNWYDSEKKSKL
jgi:hypothetical protein